ncbi:MAG: hypothetical protein QM533_11515 [Cytophagales bacterium]|nr:hypothetical protein [Cytophagales bacterium]
MSETTFPQALEISAKALEPLIAIEILREHGSALAEESRSVLERVSRGDGTGDLFNVRVDVSRLIWTANSEEFKRWSENALRYCVVRQASFPMLQRLFKTTRERVKQIRDETNSQPPPPRFFSAIDESTRHQIYLSWMQFNQEFEREADRWFMLGQKYPTMPLNVLETIVSLDVSGGSK